MLHKTRLERLATDKCSSLLNSSVSYAENEVLWIRSLMIILWSYDDHLMIFWWSSYDLLTIILWSSYDLMMIIVWSSDDHLVILWWSSYDLISILWPTLWSSYDLLMSSCDVLIIFFWWSCTCLMINLQSIESSHYLTITTIHITITSFNYNGDLAIVCPSYDLTTIIWSPYCQF